MARRRSSRQAVGLIGAVIVLLLTIGQQRGWFDTAQEKVVSNQPGLYAVDHFVDGDTIAVDMNGKIETIRMVGVDTPETHKPNSPVQCYGPAAAAYVKNIVGDNHVRLEADAQSTNRDRYNRLLRYVYLPDGRMIEREVIKNGYGFAYIDFPFTKSDEFVQLQAQAQSDNKGLWINCKPFQLPNGRWQTEDL